MNRNFAIAALLAAAAAGNAFADDISVEGNSFVSGRGRAEVVGEYLASRNAVAALTAEDSGSAYLARTRAIPAAAKLTARAQQAQ